MRTRMIPLLFMAALAAGGCAGGSTFVSTTPPPDTSGDAWFIADAPRVRNAVARSMQEHGFALDAGTGGAVVAGTKPQLVAEGRPADGRPVYRLRCIITRQGDTHVRATVAPQCAVCDGTTEFEWEYPADLVRGVLERTRTLLGERRARIDYPPRYRPPHRRRVPRRW
ncbi:MAG: hypothetical protein GF405_00365 [Candidatus Eisenbacteria bacterium]|nr:hypothetical protein [Candidatus Eisenbacteria bacterium]